MGLILFLYWVWSMYLRFPSKLSSDLRALNGQLPECSLVQAELTEFYNGMVSCKLLRVVYDFEVLRDTLIHFPRFAQGLDEVWSNLMPGDCFILSSVWWYDPCPVEVPVVLVELLVLSLVGSILYLLFPVDWVVVVVVLREQVPPYIRDPLREERTQPAKLLQVKN